jgi:hypothetical protein
MIKRAIENYSVDELGNVYSRTGRLLKCSTNAVGYRQLFVWKNCKLQRTYLIHRLVWQAFKGEIPEGLEIDHIDGNKSNNRLDNLRLVTHQHNTFNSKCKGYSFCKRTKKWMARIGCNGKLYHLGVFNTEEEASKAYQDKKAQLHIIVEVDRG